MTILRWAAALAATLLLGSCGGGILDSAQAQVRLVNASTSGELLDLRVDDKLRQGAVGFGANANYVAAEPGKVHTITRNGSSTALLTFTPTVKGSDHYTLLVYGPQGGLKQLLLDDNAADAAKDRSLLRVVNAADDAGALDIYLTGTNETLAQSVPVQAGLAVGGVSERLVVNSGNWRLRVTAAGSKTDLRLDLPSVSLNSKQVLTLVLAPTVSGALVQGLLLTQEGSIAALAPTQARLRVAAGLTDAGIVAIRLGGTPVLSNVTAPAVTPYTLVAAGPQVLSTTVNGVALADSNFTLAAGADYTLLVFGTPAAAQVSWILDDNQLPTDRTQAKLRLVNGVADAGGALSMSADFAPVADGLAAGQASAYGTLAATTTAQLAVTAAGTVTPLFSAVDQTFVAAANYTVFVVGSKAQPVGIVRKDR